MAARQRGPAATNGEGIVFPAANIAWVDVLQSGWPAEPPLGRRRAQGLTVGVHADGVVCAREWDDVHLIDAALDIHHDRSTPRSVPFSARLGVHSWISGMEPDSNVVR